MNPISKYLLPLLLGILSIPALAEESSEGTALAPFNADQFDIQHNRIERWNEVYRTPQIETPQELPEFLRPIRERYHKEAQAFIDENLEMSREFVAIKDELIEHNFRLLSRYYHIQIQYVKLCIDTSKSPHTLIEYEKSIEKNVTRLALQILKECIWCSDSRWNCISSDITNDALQQEINALGESHIFETKPMLHDYVEEYLGKQGLSNTHMLYYTSEAANLLRSSRLCDVADTFASLHHFAGYCPLAGGGHSSKENATSAASLIIQQFDTWRELIHNGICNRLFVPNGLSYYVGASYTEDLTFFYDNQEAFLSTALRLTQFETANKEANQQPTIIEHPQQIVHESATHAPKREINFERILLLTTPIWVILALLMGIYVGRFIHARA